MNCKGLDGFPCPNEATTEIEATGRVTDVASMCESCRDQFLESWERMQQDAGALRDRGLPRDELNRIMCERVDRGDYRCKPRPMQVPS